jgi:hypothetical protein
MPQPKKLGLSVPPLLRLPPEKLIRPQQTPNESGPSAQSNDFPSQEGIQEKASEISHADSKSLADLDAPKPASLARTDAVGQQIASLANSARLAKPANLAGQGIMISLMDSLPETNGFTKLHHQIVDHLYCQLSTEQVIHIQLYRLVWGEAGLIVS